MATTLTAPTEDNYQENLHQLAQFLAGSQPASHLESIATTALSEAVFPLFLYQLNENQIQLNDDELVGTLQDETRNWSMFHLLQHQSMLQINQLLTKANIRCVWFKGAALGATIYPEPYMRMKSDLDFIVPQDEVSRALEILLDNGYEVVDDLLKISTIAHDSLSHHIQLRHKTHRRVFAELHRHLLGLSGLKFLPPDHLKRWIDDAIPFQLNGQTMLMFRPEQHFLYVCAHAFLQNGEAKVKLRQLLDMHRMVTLQDMDWDVLINEAVTLKWTFLIEYALKRIQSYFDTPIDPEIFELLKTRRSHDETLNSVHFMEQQILRGESVFEYMGQLSMKDRVISMWQIAFPPRKYMRERYNISRWMPIFPYYIYRASYQLTSIIQALTLRAKASDEM